MPKHKSEDYKLSAVNYYLTENNNQLQTCKIFKCSRRSLMRWVNKYKQSNQILRQNRIPVAYKLQKDEVKHILKLIENDKTITMSDLLNKIKIKFPKFDISRRHLSNVINDNNITLKLTRFRLRLHCAVRP
jgi:transposase